MSILIVTIGSVLVSYALGCCYQLCAEVYALLVNSERPEH